MTRRIRLIHDGYPIERGMDTAVSRVLLRRASAGEVQETFRMHVPGRVIAFGKRDTLEPGYRAAVAAAREEGFDAVERLAGGRAAVFHEGTFAFSWTIPEPDPRPGIKQRFETLSSLMVRAFSRLGIAAATGEISGEYCPGNYSVHHAHRIKLMGVGQRLARHAAHIGGVVVVADSSLARRALVPVYAALGLDWDPATVGSLQDVVPGLLMHEVAAAIESELSDMADLERGHLDKSITALARQLTPEHLSPQPGPCTHDQSEPMPATATPLTLEAARGRRARPGREA
jgi:lipoate-protein ligase A